MYKKDSFTICQFSDPVGIAISQIFFCNRYGHKCKHIHAMAFIEFWIYRFLAALCSNIWWKLKGFERWRWKIECSWSKDSWCCFCVACDFVTTKLRNYPGIALQTVFQVKWSIQTVSVKAHFVGVQGWRVPVRFQVPANFLERATAPSKPIKLTPFSLAIPYK